MLVPQCSDINLRTFFRNSHPPFSFAVEKNFLLSQVCYSKRVILFLQVEFDPSEIKSKIPPQEPYTDREAAKRSDSKYDRVNPQVFIKHKESLDPRRYTADVEQLEKSALRVGFLFHIQI